MRSFLQALLIYSSVAAVNHRGATEEFLLLRLKSP